jgi:hypothetical protein
LRISCFCAVTQRNPRTVLGKLCGAGIARFAYGDAVRQRILCLLSSRRPDLKHKWEERLRAQPIRTAMAEPAILGYLMDETLDQLAAQLNRQPPAKSKRIRDFENRCRCGLNPLLAYFGTGEEILLESLVQEAPVEEPLRGFFLGQWRLLAQREIDALCGSCLRTCASPYPAAAATVSSPPSAGGCGRGT